jgi:hypothetical protein
MLSHLVTALIAFTAGFLAAGLFAAARRADDDRPRPWPAPPESTDDVA